MLIKHVTRADLENALAAVNTLFGDNVKFNRCDVANNNGDRWNVTLKVESSRGPGARRSHTGRRMASACWHVYGEFMDALPTGARINAPVVVGYDRWGREKIAHRDRSPGDEWQDWNIGSIMSPLYYSEACECGNE